MSSRAFLASCADHRLHACFTVAATTGMRRSELLALRWADVDLDAGQVSVRRGRVASGYTVHEGEPKSGRARTIAIDPTRSRCCAATASASSKSGCGGATRGPTPGIVFVREDGTPVHPHTASQTFDRCVATAPVPRIRFHDLRHTHATLLLQAGVHPKIVQERLGHSISITMDMYSHVAPGMQEDAAARLGAIVFGPR